MPKVGGRNRTPAEVHAIANRSKLSKEEIARRAEEEAAVRPRPLTPRKPAGLSRYAGEFWDETVPELVRLGLISVVDSPGFVLAAESYALARTALEELVPRKADGTPDARRRGARTVVEVDRVHGGMLKRHPAVMVYMQASGDYRRWCAEFGLTPSARMGLLKISSPTGRRGGGVDDGDGDDVEGLLGY